jgi:hypothetical protein
MVRISTSLKSRMHENVESVKRTASGSRERSYEIAVFGDRVKMGAPEV